LLHFQFQTKVFLILSIIAPKTLLQPQPVSLSFTKCDVKLQELNLLCLFLC